MPAFNDRTRCSYQIGDGLREHITRIASSKGYGIHLEVSSVSVHVVCVVSVVDQSDRTPLAIPQYLKHCCIAGHGPTAVANQNADSLALQRHDPLAIKLHRRSGCVS